MSKNFFKPKDKEKFRLYLAIIPTILLITFMVLSINDTNNFKIIISVLSLITLILIGFCFRSQKRKKPYFKREIPLPYGNTIKSFAPSIPNEKELFLTMSNLDMDISKEEFENLQFSLCLLSNEIATTNKNYETITLEQAKFYKNFFDYAWYKDSISFLLEQITDYTRKTIQIGLTNFEMLFVLYVALKGKMNKDMANGSWKKWVYREIEKIQYSVNKVSKDYSITIEESCMFLSRVGDYKIPIWAFKFAYYIKKEQ